MAEAAQEDNRPPRVTHYTLNQGGVWHPWSAGCLDAGDMFAIRLENGWIWDGVVGWRRRRP